MKSHKFTIIASGRDRQSADFEDRLFAAGCDDATIAFTPGAIVLEFDRAARNFSHAVASAIENVEQAGAHVERVEPDYLVSRADIAERSGLTRAAITNYANGERGKGFPAPIARVSSGSPLWNWVDVARWLRRRSQISAETVVEARIVKWTNDSIATARSRIRAIVSPTVRAASCFVNIATAYRPLLDTTSLSATRNTFRHTFDRNWFNNSIYTVD